MNRFTFILLAFMGSFPLFAQQDNYTFLKLIVYNTEGKVNFLVKSTKTTLMSLGYNMDIYRKQILNFNELDPIKILEELSVIYFEVFGVFGKELKLKIK